jgi:hypothetical protein
MSDNEDGAMSPTEALSPVYEDDSPLLEEDKLEAELQNTDLSDFKRPKNMFDITEMTYNEYVKKHYKIMAKKFKIELSDSDDEKTKESVGEDEYDVSAEQAKYSNMFANMGNMMQGPQMAYGYQESYHTGHGSRVGSERGRAGGEYMDRDPKGDSREREYHSRERRDRDHRDRDYDRDRDRRGKRDRDRSDSRDREEGRYRDRDRRRTAKGERGEYERSSRGARRR